MMLNCKLLLLLGYLRLCPWLATKILISNRAAKIGDHCYRAIQHPVDTNVAPCQEDSFARLSPLRLDIIVHSSALSIPEYLGVLFAFLFHSNVYRFNCTSRSGQIVRLTLRFSGGGTPSAATDC